MHALAEFFKEGGPFMVVNLVTSAVAIAIIAERTIALAFKLNLNAGPFMEQVQKLVLSSNVDRAVKLCGAAPNAALSRVIRAGLTRANRGEQEVARALEESVLEGLRDGRADRDGDHALRVSELRQYVGEKVVALSGGKQRPTSRRENLALDFRVK